MNDCFALLDDCSASADEPRSRLYTGYIGMIECRQVSEWSTMFSALQQALAAGRHAVGLFAYELGALAQGINTQVGDAPLAQMLLFAQCEHLSAQQVEEWLTAHDGSGDAPAGIANVQADVTEAEFSAALAAIHCYIEAGDTYQVNYTLRLHFDAFGTPLALYRRLRARQPVPYGALLHLPDGRAVLSLSPELFVRHRQGELTAQPMKGTAPASGVAATDAARAAALAADAKNCAENLMIVDLLRNDFGRIAATGSVRVDTLFDVRRFGDVLQMTSTVAARLRSDATLADIFAAIFPCGSITGAPKRRSMQIINELERAPRGWYTGALGWFDAPTGPHQVGDFCLAVPIRTLALSAPKAGGVRRGELGVGAGIVHDSDATDEYAECLLKARFLTALSPDFALIETMHATRAAGCRQRERHVQRLAASAAYFGLPCDFALLATLLDEACAALAEGEHRLRLTLDAAGLSVHSAPLTPLAEPVRLLLAAQPTRSDDLFLRHKTSVRQRYDAAWRSAERQGAFDMLFVNERGELTEGGRSNLFVKLDGRWYTPPLAAGVLPGVMRAVLLDDPVWRASERTLTLADVRRAQAVVVCNALRGALAANLVFDSATQ